MANDDSNQNEPDVEQVNNGNRSEENTIVGSKNTKDTDDSTSDDEPMTDAQRSYLKALTDEAGKSADENISKVEASKQIEELQHKTSSGTVN